MVLIPAGLADTNRVIEKMAQPQHGPFGGHETLTLFNEESGHLVAAAEGAEGNQP